MFNLSTHLYYGTLKLIPDFTQDIAELPDNIVTSRGFKSIK
jgi:hypothetical protein